MSSVPWNSDILASSCLWRSWGGGGWGGCMQMRGDGGWGGVGGEGVGGGGRRRRGSEWLRLRVELPLHMLLLHILLLLLLLVVVVLAPAHLRAADEADRRQPKAVGLDSFDCGAGHGRVVGEAQVVVGAGGVGWLVGCWVGQVGVSLKDDSLRLVIDERRAAAGPAGWRGRVAALQRQEERGAGAQGPTLQDSPKVEDLLLRVLDTCSSLRLAGWMVDKSSFAVAPAAFYRFWNRSRGKQFHGSF